MVNTWDKQDDESNEDYSAFETYLKAGDQRDILTAYNSTLPIKQQVSFVPIEFSKKTEQYLWWDRVRDYEVSIRDAEQKKLQIEKRKMQSQRRGLNGDLHQLARRIAKHMLREQDEDINLNDYLKLATAVSKLHVDMRSEYGEEALYSVKQHKVNLNVQNTINLSAKARMDLEDLIIADEIDLDVSSMPEAVQK